MVRKSWALIGIFICLLVINAGARGGGGCFLGNTMIQTSSGLKPISDIHLGDQILQTGEFGKQYGTVSDIYKIIASEYFILRTNSGSVSVTPEHLFYLGDGVFEEVKKLKIGDRVALYEAGKIVYEPLLSKTLVSEEVPVYNLLVDGKNTFVADSFVVHNKGSFLPDTPIMLSNGSFIPISELKPEDSLRAFTYDGEIVDAKVITVFTHEADHYNLVRTQNYEVKVTDEHPFYIGDGKFKTIENLNVGDTIYVFDGTSLSPESITLKERVDAHIMTYNPRTEWPNTYFANFIAVHNKGCFVSGTMVDTPSGKRDISVLQIGDEVTAFGPNGREVVVPINSIIKTTENAIYTLRTETHSVSVTPEHPFLTSGNLFLPAKDLKVGDTVFISNGKKLTAEKIISKTFADSKQTVYNLKVDFPNTFIANDFAVHNKGGCFVAGTMVGTPEGTVPIQTLEIGSKVLAVDENGRIVPVSILGTYKTRSVTLKIELEDGNSVETTPEHPFLLRDGAFRLAGELRAGDELSTRSPAGMTSGRIRRIAPGSENYVYNLEVESPSTFIANGFVVHNKGGGGFGGSHSSSSRSYATVDPYYHLDFCGLETTISPTPGSTGIGKECVKIDYPKTTQFNSGPLEACYVKNTDPWKDCSNVLEFGVYPSYVFKCSYNDNCTLPASFQAANGKWATVVRQPSPADPVVSAVVGVIFFILALGPFGLFLFIIIFFIAKSKFKGNDGNLDYNFQKNDIAAKSAYTAKLLTYLKGIDKTWDTEKMKATAKTAFVTLQDCWTARDYDEMEPLVFPDLAEQHKEQLESLKRNHEINKIDGLLVAGVDIINLRYYVKKDQQEFTAIIQAAAKDYYIDDRDNKFLRGDDSVEPFQEFWVFQRQGDKWLLREINQTRESDALREKNFVEDMTDAQLQAIYGQSNEGGTEAATWMPSAISQKSDKVHRMLNFLSSTDKSWDEDSMKETARKAFLGVLSAFEDQSLDEIKDSLMPNAIDSYSRQIADMKKSSASVEYRNMCVRKVDILLVRNYSDNDKDEFTVRIAAHAQKIERSKGKITSKDDYVTLFEEFLTFQKQDGAWKLREVEPPAKESSIISAENVDEESSKEMVNWYYTKDRAL